MNMRRYDEPKVEVGSLVWWKAGLYRVEGIEQQAGGWMAVVVRPGEFGAASARAWFAPCNQLQVEA